MPTKAQPGVLTPTDFSSPAFLPMGRLERRLRKMRFHMIDSSQLVSLQRTETKLLAHTPFRELLNTPFRAT